MVTLLYRLDIFSDFSMSTTHHAWSVASLALEHTRSVHNFKNSMDTTVHTLGFIVDCSNAGLETYFYTP